MPHLASPSPAPPPSPPPPPPPPAPADLSDQIGATFGFAFVAMILLVVILFALGWIVCKLNALYDRVPSEQAKVIDSTPETTEAVSDTKTIKVDSKESLPTVAKLSHVLSLIVAGVIAVCVATVLADGNSVIHLKDPQYLPIITNPNLKSIGFNHRADELLGPSYGIGLHHDQSGVSWTRIRAGKTLKQLEADLGLPVIAAALPSVIATDDLKHPVPFLECKQLQMAGLCAMWFGFIAEVVAVVMVIFHAAAVLELLPAKLVKPLAGLIWLTLTSGFLIVVLLASGIYTATWKCDNTIVPELKLDKHFDYNYGFAFAIIGYICSLLIFVVNMACTSTNYSTAALNLKKAICTILCGLTAGCVTATVLAIIVLGGNSAFSAEPAADPNVNVCAGKKPYHLGPGDNYFSNVDCMRDSIEQTLEQAGANVTRGYVGGMDAADRVPITVPYSQTDLCPVNVHWHLGAEHLSVGEYDPAGSGPGGALPPPPPPSDDHHRQLAAGAPIRYGGRCHYYDSSDSRFTTEYNWQYCVDTHVGETYEIHWPHSAAGACGTPDQYQTPFYDGVFCKDGIITVAPLNTYKKIGVQAQVFTIVNDEQFYNGNLINGMIVEGSKGEDIAMYTGSTTGTSRDNSVCSRYTPITWQVDRKCHLISASSFDKLCKDMLDMKDDMSGDVYPHGAREVVAHHLTANNQQTRQ